MKTDYQEAREFWRYLWRNYRHALTEREHALHRAATLELKARHASSAESALSLRSRDGHFVDADVAAIVKDGLGAYEQRCCERLWDDHSRRIFVNRCELCNRIVASPVACACLWCGHHWYDRRPEMIARAASSIYPKSNNLV